MEFDFPSWLSKSHLPFDQFKNHSIYEMNYDIKKIMNNANTLVTGVALGYPLTHALKTVNTKMNVIDNIDKKDMWLAFTPQLFNFKKIYNSYKKVVESKLKIDDDIQAMSFLSYKVNLLFSSRSRIFSLFLSSASLINKLSFH